MRTRRRGQDPRMAGHAETIPERHSGFPSFRVSPEKEVAIVRREARRKFMKMAKDKH